VSANLVDALPSRRFRPLLFGVGAWTDHLHFGYDVVAALRPRLLVELGTDRGESYFCFCQSVAENSTGTRCFAVDSWRGDEHAGNYDDTTFEQVAAHNEEHYAAFSTLLRSEFDDAVAQFENESVDLLHLDGLHTAEAVRHDLAAWLPKLRPGAILLLHDVLMQTRGFGVWEVWAELRERGRSFAFEIGPGLGVWQKPDGFATPLLDDLFRSPNESASALVDYYDRAARELQKQVAEKWRDGSILHLAFSRQTIVQVFYSKDGAYSEEQSVSARIGHGEWKIVRFRLPPNSCGAPLRLDFVSAFNVIDVEEISLSHDAGETILVLHSSADFDRIRVAGDCARIPAADQLRIKITGVDPQLYLPQITVPGDREVAFTVRVRVCPPDGGLNARETND
jgi:hypothetical protein